MSIFDVPIKINNKTKFSKQVIEYKSVLLNKPNREEVSYMLREIVRNNHNSSATYEKKLESYFRFNELREYETINKSINKFTMFINDKILLHVPIGQVFYTENLDHKIKLLDLAIYPSDLIYEGSYLQDYIFVPSNIAKHKVFSYSIESSIVNDYFPKIIKTKYGITLDHILVAIKSGDRDSDSLEDTVLYLKNKNRYIRDLGFKRVYEIYSHSKLSIHPWIFDLSTRYMEHIDKCLKNNSVHNIYDFKFKPEDIRIECTKIHSPVSNDHVTLEQAIINHVFKMFLFID